MRNVLRLFLIGVLVGVASPAAGQDITSNLIGHWLLTEASGTNANDSSSSNVDGTYVNGVSLASSTPVPSDGAVAATFDGFNDYVSTPSASESTYDITGNFTVAAWIKVNSFTEDWSTIISKGDGAWRLSRNGGFNTIHFAWGTPASPKYVNSTTSVNDGQWHHVAGVYNGSTVSIYIDGVFNNSASASGTVTTNNYRVYISWNDEFDNREWNGSLYDVRVYTRALSAADVAALHATTPALRAHWKLNESSGTTAADGTGNGYTGTVTGTATWTSAVRDNGFSFNGSTKIEASGLIGSPANVSVAAWAKLTAPDSSGADVITLGNCVTIRLDTSGTTIARFWNGSSYVAATLSQTFDDTGWHHFAATFDDSGNSLKLYVDGVEAASTTTSSSISYSGQGSNTRIGQHGNTSSSYDFTGTIDDVRVYNYALTAAEVAKIYGLYGHWKLTETSGTTATDSSGVANNGTYTNGVTVNAAQEGPYPGAGAQAATFDGNDDYVAMSNESYYDITDDITVAAWFKVNAFDKNYQAIIAKGVSAWRLTRNNNLSTLRFACTGTSATAVTGVTAVDDGQWHHVAGVYDGATLKLYLDGQLDNSAASTGSISTNSIAVSIGRYVDTSGTDWEGVIHDVRVYDRALSQAEVAELYGLVGHWKLDETSGTTAADSSGVGRNGTYTNGATLGGAGPIGGSFAASFDGTNDYVNIPSEWRSYANGFSFAVMGKPTAAGSGASFADFGTGQAANNILLKRVGTTTTLEGAIYDGTSGDTNIQEASAIALGAWKHYVVTVDSTGQAKLYINGVEVASSVSSVGLPTNKVRTANYFARSNWAADAYYAGQMYDMRHYNRPLSAEEVQAIYAAVGGSSFEGVRILQWVEIQ